METTEKRNSWLSGFRLTFHGGAGALKDIFLFSVFVNLLMLTGPIFMLQIYDRVLSSRSIQTLLALTILVAALYTIMGLIDFVRMRMISMMGRKRVAYYEPYVFGAQMEPKLWGAISKNTTAFKLLDKFGIIFQSGALMGYFDVFWIPIYLGAIYFLHPILGITALCAAIFLISITLLQQMTTRKQQKESMAIEQMAFDFANEATEGREVLAAQAMGPAFQSQWVEYRQNAANGQNSTSRVMSFFTSLSKSMRLLIQSMMLALGAYLVIQGSISAGSIIAGSILLGRALEPIQSILGQWSNVQAASQAMDYLDALVEKQPDIEQPMEYPNLTSDLELSGVSVINSKRKYIIAQVSAKLPAGQALGIIGLSGSGKSTVAKAILGLVPIASGEVKLGGVNRAHMSAEFFGKKIGYLPQDVQLFSGTIAQNIARMSKSYSDEDVIAAAKSAHVHELILSLNEGYDTVISAGKTTLSGGQRQRIALARALYGDPLLLILDEPNSALDDEGSKALNAAIAKLKARGGTCVIMTHRPSAIAVTEQLLVIENGRVKAYGPRDKVLKAQVKNAQTIQKTAQKEGS